MPQRFRADPVDAGIFMSDGFDLVLAFGLDARQRQFLAHDFGEFIER